MHLGCVVGWGLGKSFGSQVVTDQVMSSGCVIHNTDVSVGFGFRWGLVGSQPLDTSLGCGLVSGGVV